MMEDVEYIKKNGVEDSYLFVVDSSMRDTKAYSSPSEYSIEFSTPFHNIFGVELVSATLPRTEYSIEENANTLTYSVSNTNTSSAKVPAGDYNLLQVCEVLNETLEYGVRARPESTPFKRTSRTVFECEESFSLRASAFAKVLGFNDGRQEWTSTFTGERDEMTYYGPYPGYETTQLSAASGPLRQPFISQVTGNVSSITLHVENSPVQVRVLDENEVEYAVGTVTPPESTVVFEEQPAKTPLAAGNTYILELTVQEEGEEELEGQPAEVFINIPRADNVAAEGLDDRAVCGEIYAGVRVHQLTSPGLVDLTGEKHIVIRCPEVETYLSLQRSHEKWHAGLGMVRLGIDGFQNQSFIGFPRRTLQNPISKLSRLSFRLEKPDGSLYNARGVDHVLVLVIHYYQSVSRPSTGENGLQYVSQLNPTYTPDLLEFRTTNFDREMQYRDMYGRT